ncbi:MAG: DNA helicase, partial [Actinomycetes bacterium]
MTNIGLYRLWGSGYPGLLITMADPFSSAIRSLFPRHLGKDSSEIKHDVALVPEPEGPQGIWSISVRYEGNTIGYLPAEIAGKWAGPVRRVVASGSLPVTASTIWGNARDGWGGPTFSAYALLRLQTPVEALPNNGPPLAPYTMLPPGPFVKVIKLEEHVADLLRLTPPGSRGLFIATLRERPPSEGRRASVVEVCIDGRCVGQLTLPMSQRYLPLVQHFQGRGLVTACHVDVAGSTVASEVRIHAVKANEADDEFLRGEPVTLLPLVPRKDDPLTYDLAPMADYLRPQPMPIAAEPISEATGEPIS